MQHTAWRRTDRIVFAAFLQPLFTHNRNVSRARLRARPAQRFRYGNAAFAELKVVAVKDIALNAESMLTWPDDDGVTIGELRKSQFAVQQEVVQVDVGAHAVTALDHNINVTSALWINAASLDQIIE